MMPMKERKKSEEKKEHKKQWREYTATVEDIQNFLMDRVLLRHNVITGRVRQCGLCPAAHLGKHLAEALDGGTGPCLREPGIPEEDLPQRARLCGRSPLGRGDALRPSPDGP